jgi:zinc transporter ZupT
MASVMLAVGRGKAAALSSGRFRGAVTELGVLACTVEPTWVRFGLPLSAGVTIYVAATDLVPEVNREPGIKMALVFFAGVVVFFLLRLLGPG